MIARGSDMQLTKAPAHVDADETQPAADRHAIKVERVGIGFPCVPASPHRARGQTPHRYRPSRHVGSTSSKRSHGMAVQVSVWPCPYERMTATTLDATISSGASKMSR